MSGGLRTITILMLLAGVSLGVFATNLVARDPQPVSPVLDPRVESQVEYWTERYDLDADRTDQVRQVLQRLRVRLRQKQMDLYRQHSEEFQALKREHAAKIYEIVGETDGPEHGSAEEKGN